MSKEDKKIFYNQANLITNSLYKTESATALKIIKFCLYKLDKFWKNNNIHEKNYGSINLFEPDNWSSTENLDFNWNDFTCKFSISEFRDALKITKGGKQETLIINSISNAMKEAIMLSSDKKSEWYSWFIKVSYDKTKKNSEIKLIFNPAVLAIALQKTEQYSNLELEILGKLNSLYAIRYYELVKSRYNMKGKTKYGNKPGEWKTDLLTVDFLRKYMQISENEYSQRIDNFKKYVIEKPIEEINRISTNLQINVEYIKESKKISGIILHCNEKVITRTIHKSDSKEMKKAKIEMNESELQLIKLKNKYPKEWESYEKKVLESKLPFKTGIFLETKIYNDMIQDGFKI